MDGTPIIIKKKKSHGHAHHGGSWKVAYADFVTAMMAFFMVMWIMGLSEETKAQIQGYFNDPLGFIKNQPTTRSVVPIPGSPSQKPGQEITTPYQKERKAMEDLKGQLEKTLAETPELKEFIEHIKIEITDDGLRIEFIEDKQDFFESGKAVLKPGAIKIISALGPKLAASNKSMMIEGHTDAVPFANDPLRNFQLSTERGTALLMALGRTGVSPRRLKGVRGLADNELRDPEHPMSAVNRRVSILLPFGTPEEATTLLPSDHAAESIKPKLDQKVEIMPGKPQIVPHK